MAAPRVPMVRLENRSTWIAIRDQLEELILAGRFTLGPELEQFERQAAKVFGCDWCVGTSSGTSALALALRASGLPAGARVAIPANTFYATFEAVVMAGMRPVIIDNDEHYCIDVTALEAVDELDAVIPVHLYGLPADMNRLIPLANDRGWWVLEDASQAHGATVDGEPVGSIGHAAAFSAYPTKNLGAWGDAGFVTGSDRSVERRIRSLRHHAQDEANVHEDVGGTDRMDNIQALILAHKLGQLSRETEARRAVANRYRGALLPLGLRLPGDVAGRTHAYHQFVIRVPDRDAVRARLSERGVSSGVHYPHPVHLQPGSEGRCDVPQHPQRAEVWAKEILSLPMYPTLQSDEVERVAEALAVALETG